MGVEKGLREYIYIYIFILIRDENLVGKNLREMEKETGCEGYGGRLGVIL
jgi:hypothetical protein